MLNLLLRVLILFTIVLVAFRLMGKRQIGSFQPFEFVITLLVANVISQSIVDTSTPIMEGIVPLVGFILFQFILSLIGFSHKKARETVSGKRVAVMEDGVPNQKNIRDLLITMDDILEQLRINEQNDFDTIKDIYVETDGSVSVVKYGSKGIATTLLENGKIDYDSLRKLDISVRDLEKKMTNVGATDPKEIFWAYYFDGKIKVIPKDNEVKTNENA